MDELIWTFTQLHPDTDWEAQFHSGISDIYFEPCSFDEQGIPTLYEMLRGLNDTHIFDKDGYAKYNDRINNGLRLFGYYFRNLWD